MIRTRTVFVIRTSLRCVWSHVRQLRHHQKGISKTRMTFPQKGFSRTQTGVCNPGPSPKQSPQHLLEQLSKPSCSRSGGSPTQFFAVGFHLELGPPPQCFPVTGWSNCWDLEGCLRGPWLWTVSKSHERAIAQFARGEFLGMGGLETIFMVSGQNLLGLMAQQLLDSGCEFESWVNQVLV